METLWIMTCPYCEEEFSDVEVIPDHFINWDDNDRTKCLGSGEVPAPDNGEGGFGLNDFEAL